MKKLDLGQIVGVLANIGVIAGIIFLAVEVQQNSDLLEAETRAVRAASRTNFSALILQNDELLGSIARAEAGESLSAEDELRLYYLGRAVLIGWQSGYREAQLGNVADEAVMIDSMVEDFHEIGDVPRLDKAWERYKRNLDADFIRFMEENVVNAR